MWVIKKIVLPIAIIVASIFIFIFFAKNQKKIDKTEVKQKITIVQAKSFEPVTDVIKITGNGTVKPDKSVNLIPQVAGVITSTSANMKVGAKFKKGDLLFKIDDTEYKLRLETAKSQLASAEVQLITEEENIKIAKFEWEQYKKENPEEEAGLLTLREPQYKMALAGINSAEAAVGLSELTLKRTEIRAPFDGVVIVKKVATGQYVAPGQSLAMLYSTEKAEIVIPIKKDEMKWFNKLKKKNKVILSSGSGNEETIWNGYVSSIDKELDTQSRMVKLIVNVDNPLNGKNPLMFGLFVNAEIITETRENLYKIPRYLVDENSNVKIIAEGRLKLKEVNILKLNGDIAIIDSGITPKDRIITSRMDVAVDGMNIKEVK